MEVLCLLTKYNSNTWPHSHGEICWKERCTKLTSYLCERESRNKLQKWGKVTCPSLASCPPTILVAWIETPQLSGGAKELLKHPNTTLIWMSVIAMHWFLNCQQFQNLAIALPFLELETWNVAWKKLQPNTNSQIYWNLLTDVNMNPWS